MKNKNHLAIAMTLVVAVLLALAVMRDRQADDRISANRSELSQFRESISVSNPVTTSNSGSAPSPNAILSAPTGDFVTELRSAQVSTSNAVKLKAIAHAIDCLYAMNNGLAESKESFEKALSDHPNNEAARRAAFEKLRASCESSARLHFDDHELKDFQNLLISVRKQAADGGSVEARAQILSQTLPSKRTAQSFAAACDIFISSYDSPQALIELIPFLVHFPRISLFGAPYDQSAKADFGFALELVGCGLGADSCGAGATRTAVNCAHYGHCDETFGESLEASLFAAPNQERLRDMATRITAAIQTKNCSSIGLARTSAP